MSQRSEKGQQTGRDCRGQNGRRTERAPEKSSMESSVLRRVAAEGKSQYGQALSDLGSL